MRRLFLKKKLSELTIEAFDEKHGLKRSLGPVSLVLLGIGVIIGAGIFVLTGHAAARIAGPAIVISFVISGIACAFAGLCYAEFASMIPIAGSAYTYAYATLGHYTGIHAWFDNRCHRVVGVLRELFKRCGYYYSQFSCSSAFQLRYYTARMGLYGSSF